MLPRPPARRRGEVNDLSSRLVMEHADWLYNFRLRAQESEAFLEV